MQQPLSLARTVGAGLAGAAGSAVLAHAVGVAIAAKSREYDMGGIPIVLAAWVFVPLAGGMIAALLSVSRLYWAGGAAWLAQAIIGAVLNGRPGPDHPAAGFLLPFPITLPFALWGALLADVAAVRFREFRAASFPVVGIIAFLAMIPVADHWLPGKSAWVLLALTVGVFLWLARRRPVSPKHDGRSLA